MWVSHLIFSADSTFCFKQFPHEIYLHSSYILLAIPTVLNIEKSFISILRLSFSNLDLYSNTNLALMCAKQWEDISYMSQNQAQKIRLDLQHFPWTYNAKCIITDRCCRERFDFLSSFHKACILTTFA